MSMIAVISLFAAFQAHALPLSSEARAPDQPAPLRENASQDGTAREERQAGVELTCRMEPVIGSRFPVRRCRPANDTPQAQNAAADELRRVQKLREIPITGTFGGSGPN